MRVLVTHAYSKDNAGDAALLSVLLGDLRSVDPDGSITILTFNPAEVGTVFEGAPVQASFMLEALRGRFRTAKLVSSAYVMAATLTSARMKRRLGGRLGDVMARYESAELVVATPGGYLTGRRGFASTVELVLQLHPLVVATTLGTPVVLYSQSVGPFGNSLQARMVAWVLRRSDLVITREDISTELLASLGVSANVVRSVDAGFAFSRDHEVRPDLRSRLAVPDHRLLVGITVRHWLAGRAQVRYERAVAQMADAAIDRYGATVVFIPQVTSAGHGDDDRVVSRRVAAAMEQASTVLDDQFDHPTTKALYADLDVLVGTRFHSVIFALSSNVPALAIAYEHKTRGIMSDLDLDEWVIDFEAVTGEMLIERFAALVASSDRYRAQLHERLPGYQERAGRTRHLLQDFLPIGLR